MRVSVISPFFLPEPNGVSICIFHRSVSLSRLGINTQLIIPNYDSHEQNGYVDILRQYGIEIAYFPAVSSRFAKKSLRTGKLPKFIKSGKVIERHLANFAPDLILLDDPHLLLLFSGYYPRFKAWRQKGIESIGFCHSNMPLIFEAAGLRILPKMMNRLMPFIFNKFDYTVFPSAFAQRCFPNINNGRAIRFLGVDKSHFGFVERINSNGVKIVIVGRISPEKGIDFVYNAAKKYSESNDHVNWYFIGIGPQYDYWKNFETDHIRFAGYVDHFGLPEWYRSADILVNACNFEACSLTVIEGMSTGLAVVVPSTGVASYHFEDDVSGLSYKPREQGSLLEKIDLLVRNPSLRFEMGRRASECVLDWDAATRNLIALYHEESNNG